MTGSAASPNHSPRRNENDSTPPLATRVTTRTLAQMRRDGQRIAMLTAYDFPSAELLDQSGVDILLVGDSLAMVVGGRENTLAVTMDQMIYHGEMVARAAKRAMVVVDLPFPEGQMSIERTLVAGARVLQQTNATAVKLEGGSEQAARIEALVTAGIPVMAHVGLRPQNVHVDGGYRVQKDEAKLVHDAVAAEQAGAFAVLVECVPARIGAAIHDAVKVPTIGIGAGGGVGGQVLVTPDLIGLLDQTPAKFVRQMADVRTTIRDAAARYVAAVKDGDFPSDDESYR